MNFLGHAFELQILAFTNGRLSTVELITEFKQEIYITLLKALVENFTLVALQSAEGRLDLIETARKEGGARIGARAAEFESVALEKGQLTFFFEQPGQKLGMFRNAVEAIMGSPATAREAAVVLREKDNQAHIGLTGPSRCRCAHVRICAARRCRRRSSGRLSRTDRVRAQSRW